MTRLIEIEVACATPRRQVVLSLSVPEGCTVGEAVERSGVLRQFPELEPERCKMGVFGSLRKPGDPVAAGDRVEIYRALLADPKQARRQRAETRQAKR